MKFKYLMFAGGIGLFACNNSGTSSTSNDTTANSKTDTTATAPTTAVSSPEQDFINYAVPGNTKEIIWMEAGINHGQNKELKSHAKMMLKDHKKLGESVQNYLSSHSNMTVPTVDTSNVVTIQNKMGKDWDKAWADEMVNAHSDLLGKLQQSQTQVKDTALLSIINGAIPVVESHLAMVKSLQKKLQ